MRPLTLEYIAGFVDGEGSFMINKPEKGLYKASFMISNSNKNILKDIKEYFSIGLKIRPDDRKNPKRKITYSLETTNIYQVKSIARKLYPHLRLKQKQAEIMMEYPSAKAIKIGGLSSEDHSTKALQGKLCRKIRALNKKGPSNQESNGDPQEEPDPQLGLF